jgi:hypothetical protein
VDAFRQGEASSYIVTLLITQVSQTGDKDTAEVEFTSVQDPVAGSTGHACSNWNSAYTLIPGDAGWLIDTARPHPGNLAAC